MAAKSLGSTTPYSVAEASQGTGISAGLAWWTIPGVGSLLSLADTASERVTLEPIATSDDAAIVVEINTLLLQFY